MLKLIMVLLWMILLVLLLCAEAENVTEVRGELGTNVTLTCSNQTADPYWYMEIHSQFRAGIGRSFSSAGSTYYSPGFETKFSILGNKLVIKNYTAEDCRLYFCGIKRGGSIQFLETFFLVSESDHHQENSSTSDHHQENSSTSDHHQENSSTSDHQVIIVYRSAFVITALFLLMLAVVFASLWLKRKSQRDQADEHQPVTK
ncbi:uncharacterized protein LOC120746052 [Simochromis diagramma]|uniref:uncharacterized protein LOC120746052 n=1 Tax=Simochromis diagramma TaxID=43689 RepID=UPI001A7E7DD4|nr:uncharacterized protein LOC120746052 [Simochromis diagramma]